MFGEADILRVLLLLPGVKAIGKGSTGFSVRGGGADQNLVLCNDALIYKPSHLFGFFSAFNAGILKSAELYKGTVPARYGGRLSSVLDVMTRAGNRKQFSATGGIELLTSRLTLEGPLASGKGSWLVGGRTTYSDWLLRQLPSRNLQNSVAGFSDLSRHVAYDLNNHNSLPGRAQPGRPLLPRHQPPRWRGAVPAQPTALVASHYTHRRRNPATYFLHF